MKISITAHDCARIYLSGSDLRRLGLTDTQGEPTAEMRLLVSGIAAFLSQLGLFELGSGEIDCTVSEVFDGIVVQIAPKESACAGQTKLLFVFDGHRELKEFCFGLSEDVCAKIVSSELYRLEKRYLLIVVLNCPMTSLPYPRLLRRALNDEVLTEKAREHGELLSRTPIEDIRKLRYP